MYSTLATVKKRISEVTVVQLTDDDGIGVINQGNFDEASKAAYAEVNGYCGGRYHVPFETVPDLLQILSDELTIYYLHLRRVSVPEEIVTRYDNAIKKLEGISKGVISLGVDPAPSAANQTNNTVLVETSEKIYSRDKMTGY